MFVVFDLKEEIGKMVKGEAYNGDFQEEKVLTPKFQVPQLRQSPVIVGEVRKHLESFTTLSQTEARSLSSTVGSEAWNSRDLKSRPH